jgi:hypothetical protein
MDSRNEIFSRLEKLWVLCIGQESIRKPLPPLADTIDWFNNQLITKSLLKDQVKVEFSAKTLLATAGQLPVSRLLVLGLGDEKDLSDSQGKIILTELDLCLEGLEEKAPWIIITPSASSEFVSEIKKGCNRHPQLANSSISVG